MLLSHFPISFQETSCSCPIFHMDIVSYILSTVLADIGRTSLGEMQLNWKPPSELIEQPNASPVFLHEPLLRRPSRGSPSQPRCSCAGIRMSHEPLFRRSQNTPQ